MKFLLLPISMLAILFSCTICAAKTIPINVDVQPNINHHIRIINQANAGDVLNINVSDRIRATRPVVCRYISALRSTKANVRLVYVPDTVKRYAGQCGG